MSFTHTDDVIDSRDIIERIAELENILRDEYEELPKNEFGLTIPFDEWVDVILFEHDTEGYEYKILVALAEECEQYTSDWEHGEALIHESYFEQYMDEMISDCYEIPKGLPFWIRIEYDYDALKMDYTEVTFNGETYFIRSV